VMTAVLAGGRGFAEQIRLVPWGDSREEACAGEQRRGRRGGRSRSFGAISTGVSIGSSAETPPWPGRLEKPSPALVYDDMPEAQLRDGDGLPVEVNGRGMLSSPPSTLTIGRASPMTISAWAGPWPLEERWWDRGGRRRARIQVQLDNGEAHLLSREKGGWWVEATYG
jgi:protein ImuB